MTARQVTTSGSSYAVKQIRGPFVELDPHPCHTRSDTDLAALCTDLRAHGVPLVADLFSGAGGMSLGFEEAGFRVVLGSTTMALQWRRIGIISPGCRWTTT